MTLLSLARDLNRRKAREQRGLFVAEGVRAVEELLRSPLTVRGVLVAPQLDGAQRGAELHATLASRNLVLDEVTEREFATAAQTESPQGVLAIGEIPNHDLASLAGRNTFRLLVLDAVQDPGNTGTILRTAAALGVTATIALPGTVDLWNAKVVRSAMGAHFHHVTLSSTPDALREFLSAEHGVLWGADASGEPVELFDAPQRLALAVGNEGSGLGDATRKMAERLVALRIANDVESLNVAVATGILLYALRS